jgi:thioredoxin reductase (NADPH)
MFEAKTVIIATGVEAVKPIPGELEFVGRGVSYCATCDGFLYKGKTIGVLCTTKDLEHEIEYLADLAEKVYLIPLYKNVELKAENVEIIQRKPKAIEGGMKAEKLVFEDREVAVDGIFMLKQAVAPSVLLYGLNTEEGHIIVDRACRTNLPGCFAAGDCTGRPYQYVKAAGEGNVAAHSAVEYLAGNQT